MKSELAEIELLGGFKKHPDTRKQSFGWLCAKERWPVEHTPSIQHFPSPPKFKQVYLFT